MKMMKRQWNTICKASKSALWLKVREKEHTLNMNWDFFSSLKTYCCNSLLPASVDTITHPPGLARNLSYPCHPSTAGKFLFSSTSSACPVHYISQISPIYPPPLTSVHCPIALHVPTFSGLNRSIWFSTEQPMWFSLIGVWLLDKGVLVSPAWWSGSAICITYIPPTWPSLPPSIPSL